MRLPKDPKVNVIFDRYENILYTQSFSIICREFFLKDAVIRSLRNQSKVSLV